MTPLAVLAAAGLVARLAAAAAPPAPAPSRPPPDVTVEGDVSYDAGTGALLVENGAVLRRGPVTIRARSATYDPATGEVRASGGVLLTDPTRVVRADALRAVLDGPWEAEGVVAFVKDVPVELGAVDTLEAARTRGRNRLSLSGSAVEGEPSGRFFLQDARLTLCDCPGACAPSWEVTSRRADVIPGKRAILTWPVLRITPRFLFVQRPIPVLVVPWLYLPLGDRQTGLLLPGFRKNSREGFVLYQPLFVTLGRSADATLTALYAFGGDRIRGPGASLELRWAPALHAEGAVQLDWLHDEKAEAAGASGDRFALQGSHRQPIGERGSAVALLQLAGDPVWVVDHHLDNVRLRPYQRSAVVLSRASDAWVLEGDAGYLQPLRPNGVDPARPWGALGADDRLANRWPAASASLLPNALGPLQAAARVGAVRYAPVSGAVDATGRPAGARASGQVELAAPLLLGGALSLAPYVRGAAAGYAFESSQRALTSAWGIAGVAASTEVSRSFGALRHAIQPTVEWRGGTAPAGDRLPGLAWDEEDRSGGADFRLVDRSSGQPATAFFGLSSGPPGAWSQLRASVATRLSRGGSDLVRLELGQDLDARRGRFTETFVSAGGGAGGVSADLGARFYGIDARQGPVVAAASPSKLLDRFTELHASVSASDRRRDSLSVSFGSVGPGASSTLVAGRDPLFDARAVPFDVASAYVGGAARAMLGPATLGYDVALFARRSDFPCADRSVRHVGALRPSDHHATFVWNSPCRCFRFVASAGVNACGEVSYDVSLDVSQLAAGVRSP